MKRKINENITEANVDEHYVKLVSDKNSSYLKFKFTINEIDKDKALVIQSELKTLITDNIDGKNEIIFDVENIKIMSIKMINVLMTIRKEANGKIDITLEGLKKNKDLLTMFEMIGLTDLFIIESNELNEDDIVAEASRWECEITKEKEDGEDVWSVYEKKTHLWVATFQDEQTANAFAESYPKIKEDHLKRAQTIESDCKIDEADDREPISHALDAVGIKASTANTIDQDAVEMQLIEKEIDTDIEEAMKEIYK